MILLDFVEPQTRGIGWCSAKAALPGAEDSAQVEARLRELGVLRFRNLLRRDRPAYSHRWSIDDGSVVYRSQCPLASLSPSEFAFYASAMLATITWASVEQLMSVHLALYELVVNVCEHGRPLAGSRSPVMLELRVSPEQIEGHLVDGCEEFDATARVHLDVSTRVAQRHRRGYGVTMIERSLDAISYEFGPRGNTVHILKRIQS